MKVVRDMTPWRIAVDPTAHAVVELPAGSLRDRRSTSAIVCICSKLAESASDCQWTTYEGAVLSRKSLPDAVLEPEQQYAVVLLNDEQLSQLMRKPGMRPVNRGHSVPDVHMRYLRLKRQTAAAAALLLVLGAGSFLYFMAPQPAMASMFAWKELPEAPTLDTGASFSVTIQTTDSGDGAGFAANRVRTLGFPSFTRVSPGRHQLHQAMVGPYASLDEAEKSAASPDALGIPGGARSSLTSRCATRRATTSSNVDVRGRQSDRRADRRAGSCCRWSSSCRSSRDRCGRDEPRTCSISTSARCPSKCAAAVESRLKACTWSSVCRSKVCRRRRTGDFLRAHVTCPSSRGANVRAEGRRVYVDLTWPLIAPDAVAPRPAAAAAEAGPAQPPPSRVVPVADARQGAQSSDAYAEQLRGVVERLGDVKPFLMSAAKAGSPDVLRALDDTLSTLETSLRGMRAPAASVDQYQMFVSAIRTARKATDVLYTGDRNAQAREAFVLYDAAVNAGSLITPVAR